MDQTKVADIGTQERTVKQSGEVSLSGVATLLHRPVQEYVETLSTLAGLRLQGLSLIGEAALPDFDPTTRSARNVIVLDRMDLALLRRLSAEGARFGRGGIAAPLVMTWAYIESSLDTFPLEFLEIQQFHRVLLGEDYFAKLSFDDVHVRLQAERELKVLLIGLRQGLLAAAGREKVLSALETDAAEGLLRTIRGILWLRGHKDALPKSRALDEMESVLQKKLGGVRAALDPNTKHGWSIFEQLYGDVGSLEELVHVG